MIAKTEASGGPGLLPEVLAFTSSLPFDRGLLREDLVGSLAHLAMLARVGLVPTADADAIRAVLVSLWDRSDALPEEEDVHMAVESVLRQSLGERAGLLHTARSRNDQVALDLRLRGREVCAQVLAALGALLETLALRARADREVLLPAYTHRQRAQPVSAAYYFCGYGAMLARDVDAFAFALEQVNVLPLGVGAIAGTSLPIDRELTRELLRFPRLTVNGLDTVGDRDFALDLSYAVARCMLHLSRLATDFIDFASQEFGYVTLDGQIACGSSMMPQKRNPDLFELIRSKSGRAVGNLMSLLTLVKGLPGGYNRDLQDDRQPFLESGPLLLSALSACGLALAHVRFNQERCRDALAGDFMQATDLAEALARKGVPFRTAYQVVGALVKRCQDARLPLAAATLEMAQALHPAFDEETLRVLEPSAPVARKTNIGGTGPAQLTAQIEWLEARAGRAKNLASGVPRLAELFESLRGAKA